MATEEVESEVKEEKKPLTTVQIVKLCLLALDVLVTIFLLTVSIVLLANVNNKTALASATGFMGMIYLFMDGTRNGPTLFLCIVVIPLFVLLVVNIIITVLYYQKEAAKEKEIADKAKTAAPSLNSLSDAQKEALRQELLKEMGGEKKEEPKEEAKAEEAKPEETK